MKSLTLYIFGMFLLASMVQYPEKPVLVDLACFEPAGPKGGIMNAYCSGNEKKIQKYIDRFRQVAKAEERKFGIPACIKMAQGILESGFGTSTLAVKNHNHFGVKCFSKRCKKGHCTNRTDDSHKDFFRKYPNAWASWRAHSQHLSNSERYKKLFETSDYKKWAYGLKKAGYATDAQYPEKLIGIIEYFNLSAL